jgi:hypothetical protein
VRVNPGRGARAFSRVSLKMKPTMGMARGGGPQPAFAAGPGLRKPRGNLSGHGALTSLRPVLTRYLPATAQFNLPLFVSQVRDPALARHGRGKLIIRGISTHVKETFVLGAKANPAGFTFIKNKKDLVIQNDKGVVIDLKGHEIGLELDLTTEGLNIKDIME